MPISNLLINGWKVLWLYIHFDSCKEVFGGGKKIMSCEPQNDLVNKCYILFFINVTECVPHEVNPTTVGGKKKN